MTTKVLVTEEDITGWKESRKFLTRDWRKVRIYSTDGAGFYPIHGAICNKKNQWVAHTWTPDGRYGDVGTASPNDLVSR